MTARETVLALEEVYAKQLNVNQASAYIDKLEKFSPDQLQRIFDQVLETCKYFPKIADFFEAAKDLLIIVGRGRRVPDPSCDCEGTGWAYVTSYHSETGETFDSVESCGCFSRKIDRPDPPLGPGGWVIPA